MSLTRCGVGSDWCCRCPEEPEPCDAHLDCIDAADPTAVDLEVDFPTNWTDNYYCTNSACANIANDGPYTVAYTGGGSSRYAYSDTGFCTGIYGDERLLIWVDFFCQNDGAECLVIAYVIMWDGGNEIHTYEDTFDATPRTSWRLPWKGSSSGLGVCMCTGVSDYLDVSVAAP